MTAAALRSSFRDGRYTGPEVGLRVVRRNRGYEPLRVEGPDDVYAFMRDLGHESSEYLYELLLNAGCELNGLYLVGKGSCRRCLVDPLEVYKPALVTNSPNFMLVHNHPSGDAEPSIEDKAFAQRISKGAGILGLHFLDMLVICDRGFVSMAERELIRRGDHPGVRL